MDELGFRFEEEAVILERWAHRLDCPRLPATIPAHAHRLAVGEVFRSHYSPRACWTCTPTFVTLLSHEIRPHGRDEASRGCRAMTPATGSSDRATPAAGGIETSPEQWSDVELTRETKRCPGWPTRRDRFRLESL